MLQILFGCVILKHISMNAKNKEETLPICLRKSQ